MGDDEEKGKKRKKRDDYTELEFELGELEFEAKGKATVVERMFYTLLEKLETGKLKAITSTVKELEGIVDDLEEEDESEEESSEEEESVSEEEEPSVESEEPWSPDDTLEPPPAWDSLDREAPPESDAERGTHDS
ncbi:MAG: hypothetical protein JSW61_09460 [Candidatus Thorarchaeota archaeon]|nr:MAG: hypothetical protein JSW61_09460 [Candidatus Thorarchaeota archaeon]